PEARTDDVELQRLRGALVQLRDTINKLEIGGGFADTCDYLCGQKEMKTACLQKIEALLADDSSS
ncbi:MAG: hypothetical protein AAGB04_30750, partial [Pseudomonadota bacterium]